MKSPALRAESALLEAVIDAQRAGAALHLTNEIRRLAERVRNGVVITRSMVRIFMECQEMAFSSAARHERVGHQDTAKTELANAILLEASAVALDALVQETARAMERAVP